MCGVLFFNNEERLVCGKKQDMYVVYCRNGFVERKQDMHVRIDKVFPGAALYLGTCLHNNGNCTIVPYIVWKIISFST